MAHGNSTNPVHFCCQLLAVNYCEKWKVKKDLVSRKALGVRGITPVNRQG